MYYNVLINKGTLYKSKLYFTGHHNSNKYTVRKSTPVTIQSSSDGN